MNLSFLLLTLLTGVFSLEEYVQYYEFAAAKPSIIETSDKHISAYLEFDAHGRNFRLHLTTNQHLFSSKFRLRVHREKGQHHHLKMDTRHIVIGHVIDDKNSIAHGKVKEDHFEGIIHTEKDTYHVELIKNHFKERLNDHHNVVVYKASDVNFTYPSTCGVNTKLSRLQESAKNIRRSSTLRNYLRKRQSDSENTCTMHVYSDYDFYSNIGNNDEATTLEAMALHITESNLIYRATAFQNGQQSLTNYGLAITAADVSNDVIFDVTSVVKRLLHWLCLTMVDLTSDVITSNSPKDNPLYGNFEVDELLQNFAAYDFDSVCLGHLFTYRDFSGTIGLAYVADPDGRQAGGICQQRTQTYGGELNLNTGLTTLITFGRRLPQGVSIITTAHEIGHNFGSPHDPSGECAPGGSQGNYIMYATATDGNLPNNKQFSSCSRDIMGRTIANNGDCFVEEPFFQVCGNGIVEGTEECDCGSNSTCKNNDPCCKIGECLLESNATCSPHKYACCTSECTPSPVDTVCSRGDECLIQSICNGVNETCPSPTRDNSSFCNNGNNVCVDGVCSGSVCLYYNLSSCFCTEQNKLCDVCCVIDGQCISTHDRQGIVNATIQSGFPCKDFTGYCNDDNECIFVDTNIPLDDLADLIPSFSSIVDWLKDNWYWVVGGVITTIIIIILLQVTYRRKNKKKSKRTTNEATSEAAASENLRLLEQERRRQQTEATRL